MNRRDLNNLNFRLTLEDLAGRPESTIDRVRYECQTNLRFLTNCVMRPRSSRFKSLSENFHGQMIESFLEPSPDRPYDEWSDVKERVTKATRGGLKSTLVAGFHVQVQLCDPNIRLLIVSGKLPMAKTILETSRSPFVGNEVLQFLFPDYAVEPNDLYGESFTCPLRDPSLNLRDPTLSIATFESVKAGGHFELITFDDCTNEINCKTAELVEKCTEYYDDTDPLVEPGGYRHFFGTTWADENDLPEVIRRRGEAYSAEHNNERNVIYMSLPAWKLRESESDVENAEIIARDEKNQLRESDVVLQWPEKLSLKFLWPIYRKKPRVFNMQYLLRYRESMTDESFSDSVMLGATRPFNEGIPMAHDRLIVVNWDLAGIYTGRRQRKELDFSCGLAVMFELSTRRMFIYDAVLEIFMSSTDAAQTIVNFQRRQLRVGPVTHLDIEDTAGSRMLEGEILSTAKRAEVDLTIRWQTACTVMGAKALRIAKLAGAARRGLVQFATNIPQRDEIFKQFKKWRPENKRVKDDAPDCAAQIWENYSEGIRPGIISNLQPSDVTIWAPEPMPISAPDPHADERENADIDWLSQMTVAHS